MPDKWAVTAWQNVQYNDNSYIKSKTLNATNLGAIMFFNLGFSIPAGATITKIDAAIIRHKTGKNAVYEYTVALLKHLNDTEACGGSPNMASTDPWTTSEKKMLYSFGVNGSDCYNQPFKWTAEEVNKPMFGLMLHPRIATGGSGATVLIEQVTVTVYYTEQSSTTLQTRANTALEPFGGAAPTRLEQNTPNPVRGSTSIRYHVPETSTSARLTFTNAKGQVVKTVSINNRGTGQLSLNTHVLAAGTYHYTLYVDGKQMGSKQLVIAR
jgi:hypothetical protein